ncbi:MAG: hypothetical protein ACRCT8_03830 [Lacipirellulaceae bacterium]
MPALAFGRRVASIGFVIVGGASPTDAACPCEGGGVATPPPYGSSAVGGPTGGCEPHAERWAPEAQPPLGFEGADAGVVPAPEGVGPQDALGEDLGRGNEQPAAGAGSALPAGLGAVAAAGSPSVSMIGDFFGSGYFLTDGDGTFSSVSSAGGDRRYKATDNLSPVPQDRVFFNYHHFHNAVIDVNGADQNVNRYTLGLEKAYWDKMASVEVRAPIIDGLESFQGEDPGDTTTSSFGNLSITVKARLLDRGPWVVTSGLATVLPTASDAQLGSSASRIVLENGAVHLQPYVGLGLQRPNSRWFSQAYLAVDVDVNGNPLSTRNNVMGTEIVTPFGDIRDQTLLFADWQLGYWLYQDHGHVGYINGIAPVFEIHVTTALDDPAESPFIGAPFGRPTLVNLTGGLVFDIRRDATVTVYGAAPLDRQEAFFEGVQVSPVFDAEFGVQCVYRY